MFVSQFIKYIGVLAAAWSKGGNTPNYVQYTADQGFASNNYIGYGRQDIINPNFVEELHNDPQPTLTDPFQQWSLSDKNMANALPSPAEVVETTIGKNSLFEELNKNAGVRINDYFKENLDVYNAVCRYRYLSGAENMIRCDVTRYERNIDYDYDGNVIVDITDTTVFTNYSLFNVRPQFSKQYITDGGVNYLVYDKIVWYEGTVYQVSEDNTYNTFMLDIVKAHFYLSNTKDYSPPVPDNPNVYESSIVPLYFNGTTSAGTVTFSEPPAPTEVPPIAGNLERQTITDKYQFYANTVQLKTMDWNILRTEIPQPASWTE